MTRNMYVGANVDAVIAALITPDPADDQTALFEAISTLQDFLPTLLAELEARGSTTTSPPG
jgi:hypothetical protein